MFIAFNFTATAILLLSVLKNNKSLKVCFNQTVILVFALKNDIETNKKNRKNQNICWDMIVKTG